MGPEQRNLPSPRSHLPSTSDPSAKTSVPPTEMASAGIAPEEARTIPASPRSKWITPRASVGIERSYSSIAYATSYVAPRRRKLPLPLSVRIMLPYLVGIEDISIYHRRQFPVCALSQIPIPSLRERRCMIRTWESMDQFRTSEN